MEMILRPNPKTGEPQIIIPQDRLVIQFEDGSFLYDKFDKLLKEFKKREGVDETMFLEFIKLILEGQYKNIEGIAVDNINNYNMNREEEDLEEEDNG